MPRHSFEHAEALVYDPVPMNRNATRTTLYSLGFRRIEAVGTLEAFRSQIRKSPPDITLCEAQPAREVCGAIQDIRQGTSTSNPFLVVMVTAWENTDGLVGRVLNSGADDLLLRPFSATILAQRIKVHVERRKGFVVTTDYVGPDRRSDAIRPSNVPLFEPPNSLRMKVRDGLTGETAAQRFEAELKVACDILQSEKLRRDAFQICILWRLIQSRVAGAPASRSDLAKLKDLTRSIERRGVELQIEHADEWCQSILAAVEGFEFGVDRHASLHLLGHAALSLNQLFSPEKTTSDHLTHIDATVALIHARSDTAMAS
jgi:CheY-like chemotaxis protein